jgi:hypothetical protein
VHSWLIKWSTHYLLHTNPCPQNSHSDVEGIAFCVLLTLFITIVRGNYSNQHLIYYSCPQAGRAFTFYSQGNTIFKGVHELTSFGSLR